MKKLFTLFAILIMSINVAFATGTEALLFYNKGIDYYKKGAYDEAINYFRRSIDVDPDFIDAYYNLGTVLEYLEQYDSALTVFKQIIVREPEDYDAVYRAAWLSYKLGEINKAKTYLALIPENSARYNDAKSLLSQLGGGPIPKPTTFVEQQKTSGLYENITSPTGVVTDNDGNIYVGQYGVNSVLKITTDGKKILYLKDPKINGPIGLAFDSRQNLYIANYNADNVLKVTRDGAISVLISSVKNPYGLYIKNDILYVTLQGASSVLKYKLRY